MAGGQAIEGAKRGVLFHVDPSEVELQGIDYSSGPEDVCYNPRNKDPVDEGLIESIMRLGVLEPIGVVKGKVAEAKIRVIYGNQRVRAAREANTRLRAAGKEPVSVPCLTPLRGFSDDELGEVAIAENEHRRESSAVVKSELAAIQLKRKGGDMAEAAKAFGMRIDQFKALINLKEAAPEIKAAIKSGAIGTTAAMELAGLPREDQSKHLDETVAAGGTIAAAKETAKKAKGTVTSTKPSKTLIETLASAATQRLLGPDTVDREDYTAGFADALLWVLGEIKATDVEGLPVWIAEVTAGKAAA